MEREPIDHDQVRRQLADSCFICELVAGNPDHVHHIIHLDDESVAFLSKFPTLLGYVIVAPRQHKEQVTGDFTEDEYAELQRVIHRVGEAIRDVIPTERLYVLSLGSQQANRHVHWHLAPLPPGVPLDQQQYRALDCNDFLTIAPDEMGQLAQQLRTALSHRRDITR